MGSRKMESFKEDPPRYIHIENFRCCHFLCAVSLSPGIPDVYFAAARGFQELQDVKFHGSTSDPVNEIVLENLPR